MGGGEGNAALYRFEKRRMFRLLKMIRRMLGRAGLVWNKYKLLLSILDLCCFMLSQVQC